MMSDKEYMELKGRSGYPDGTRFQVLLSGNQALSMLEDWLTGNCRADLRVRRARTKRMVVIETTDVVFSSRMVMRNPGCKVNIAVPHHGFMESAAALPQRTEHNRR